MELNRAYEQLVGAITRCRQPDVDVLYGSVPGMIIERLKFFLTPKKILVVAIVNFAIIATALTVFVDLSALPSAKNYSLGFAGVLSYAVSVAGCVACVALLTRMNVSRDELALVGIDIFILYLSSWCGIVAMLAGW